MWSLSFIIFLSFSINHNKLLAQSDYLTLSIKNKITECNGTAEFYNINKLICSPCPPNSYSPNSDSKYLN